jgi:hypothetical protein
MKFSWLTVFVDVYRCPIWELEASRNEEISESLLEKIRTFSFAPTAPSLLSEIKGWGLRAVENIPCGGLVGELVGEVYKLDEYIDNRVSQPHPFLFLLDRKHVLDCLKQGNITRCVNHSHTPNAKFITSTIDGFPRLFIIATQDVVKGSELTVNYSNHVFGPPDEQIIKCFCGAENCTGVVPFLNVRALLGIEQSSAASQPSPSKPKVAEGSPSSSQAEGGEEMQVDQTEPREQNQTDNGDVAMKVNNSDDLQSPERSQDAEDREISDTVDALHMDERIPEVGKDGDHADEDASRQSLDEDRVDKEEEENGSAQPSVDQTSQPLDQPDQGGESLVSRQSDNSNDSPRQPQPHPLMYTRDSLFNHAEDVSEFTQVFPGQMEYSGRAAPLSVIYSSVNLGHSSVLCRMKFSTSTKAEASLLATAHMPLLQEVFVNI